MADGFGGRGLDAANPLAVAERSLLVATAMVVGIPLAKG